MRMSNIGRSATDLVLDLPPVDRALFPLAGHPLLEEI